MFVIFSEKCVKIMKINLNLKNLKNSKILNFHLQNLNFLPEFHRFLNFFFKTPKFAHFFHPKNEQAHPHHLFKAQKICD